MATALVFLLILMSAVLVHELAHFLNALSVGVPVRAFSIGMGPIVFRRRWRGTEWRISLLPLGGYVDLPGMAPKVGEDGQLQHPDEGMALKPLPQKLWVLFGGVLANFLLGILLVTAAIQLEPGYREFTSGVVAEESGALISGVVEGSTAERIGIRAGDVLVGINGIPDPSREQVIQVIREADGLELELRREGAALTLGTPWPPDDADGRPLLGIQLEPLVVEDLSVGLGTALSEASRFGVRILPEMAQAFVRGFGTALSGRQNQDIAGPVGIVTAVNQARQVGIAPVLLLAAIINFSLAVFNLLPIPGLDGGRMLLATLVALRGRPLRPGQEETIHFFGILTVIALIVLITFNELSGLLRG